MCQSVPIVSSTFRPNIIWIGLHLEKLSQNKNGKLFIETQCRGRPTSWYNSNGYRTLVLPFLQYEWRILWSVPSIIGDAEWNNKLSYRRDSARRRSLCRLKPPKVAVVSTCWKPVCNFLLVNNTNLHPILRHFPVIAQYRSNYCFRLRSR